jgi:hypothetical protein
MPPPNLPIPLCHSQQAEESYRNSSPCLHLRPPRPPRDSRGGAPHAFDHLEGAEQRGEAGSSPISLFPFREVHRKSGSNGRL